MTTTEPAVDDPVDVASAASSETNAASTKWGAARLAAVLVVLAVGVAALGVWFTVEMRAVRSSAAAQNQALVDTGRTAEVSAAVTNSLNKVFSYSFDKPEVTEQAAANALRGPALDSYNRLFAQVRELAPQQKIVLTTRVVHIAVQSLTGDRAQLLVFLDQSATRADNNTNSAGAAQLSVTAERQDGSWVIIDLTPR
jgi:Mce-associated membrane protein